MILDPGIYTGRNMLAPGPRGSIRGTISIVSNELGYYHSSSHNASTNYDSRQMRTVVQGHTLREDPPKLECCIVREQKPAKDSIAANRRGYREEDSSDQKLHVSGNLSAIVAVNERG